MKHFQKLSQFNNWCNIDKINDFYKYLLYYNKWMLL